MMPDTLRPYISRVVAAIVTWLASWIGAKLNIEIAQDIQLHIVEIVVILIIYSITHKAMDSKVNPHDVASRTAAKETKGAP